MEAPDPRSFDARAFWITFAACVIPPLASIALFMVGADVTTGWANSVMAIAFPATLSAWGVAYVIAFVWMVGAFMGRDRARGLAIFLGMLAAAIVGVGSCFSLIATMYP